MPRKTAERTDRIAAWPSAMKTASVHSTFPPTLTAARSSLAARRKRENTRGFCSAAETWRSAASTACLPRASSRPPNIKIDCEGFDPEVLRGARSYLANSNVLCVTVETNFRVSPSYLRTPFAEINDVLVVHRLLVFDLNFVRAARPSYTAARAAHPWPAADAMHDSPDLDVGQPATFDFVFCRDLVQEHTSPQVYAAE